MAGKVIKGLTVEIGGDTTKLGKALENVEQKSRNLSSELGEINRLLKVDPSNTELLAQKQKVLADAVSNTKNKLDTLRQAEQQVQAQFARGEVSEEQYRALQREIVATEKKLSGYENAAKTAKKAYKEACEFNQNFEITKIVLDEMDRFNTVSGRIQLEEARKTALAGYSAIYEYDYAELRTAKSLPNKTAEEKEL